MAANGGQPGNNIYGALGPGSEAISAVDFQNSQLGAASQGDSRRQSQDINNFFNDDEIDSEVNVFQNDWVDNQIQQQQEDMAMSSEAVNQQEDNNVASPMEESKGGNAGGKKAG